MSTTVLPRCLAEAHRNGLAVQCVMGQGHDGHHWALTTAAFGVPCMSWTGTDSEPIRNSSTGDES